MNYSFFTLGKKLIFENIGKRASEESGAAALVRIREVLGVG